MILTELAKREWDGTLKAPQNPSFGCKECKTMLFGKDNMLDHSPLLLDCYQFSDEVPELQTDKKECPCYFVEPLDWMGDVSRQSGTILCSGCQNEIGRWNWGRLECEECCSAISPAFKVRKDLVVEGL